MAIAMAASSSALHGNELPRLEMCDAPACNEQGESTRPSLGQPSGDRGNLTQ